MNTDLPGWPERASEWMQYTLQFLREQHDNLSSETRQGLRDLIASRLGLPAAAQTVSATTQAVGLAHTSGFSPCSAPVPEYTGHPPSRRVRLTVTVDATRGDGDESVAEPMATLLEQIANTDAVKLGQALPSSPYVYRVPLAGGATLQAQVLVEVSP